MWGAENLGIPDELLAKLKLAGFPRAGNTPTLTSEVGGDPVGDGSVPVGMSAAMPPVTNPISPVSISAADPMPDALTPLTAGPAVAAPDRLADLNTSLAKLDQKPSLGRGILGALLRAAPLALAAKFGGTAGLRGAATGEALAGDDLMTQRNQRRQSITAQIQQETDRRERQREFDANQARQEEQTGILRQTREDALNTKTASFTDPNTGEATTFQYNPKTNRYDIPLGPVASKPGAAKPDLEVKMVEGAPVVYQRSTNKYYDPNDKAAPPDVKAAASPFLSAHAQHLREETAHTGQMAGAQESARIAVVDRRVRQRLLPIAEKTIDTDNRLTRMRDDEAKGNAGDPQADQDMLYNHMAMTVGGVTGGRITGDIIQKHIDARSVPEDVGVIWKKIANGETLSPAQRRRMVSLGEETSQLAHEKLDRLKDLYGITDMDLKPSAIQADHAQRLNGSGAASPQGAVPPGFVKPKKQGE